MTEFVYEPDVIDLSDRHNDGLDVVLYWVKDTLSTYVELTDRKLGGVVLRAYTPDGVNPNDVFYHPFAYNLEQVIE